jgi:hypothetical protein
MKAHRLLIIPFIVIVTIAGGCKYDVDQPLWSDPAANSVDANITSVDPLQATPGVNTITIYGSNLLGAFDTTMLTNHQPYTDSLLGTKDTVVFDSAFVYNGIFFDNVQATVLEITSTMIKVNRPNVASASCTIKISSQQALTVSKYGPYRIDPVSESYGAFTANVALGATALDNAGNLYVTESANRYLWKVGTNGVKSQILIGDTASLVLRFAPSDMRIGPDGNLYYFNNVFPNTKYIQMVVLNPASVQDSAWYTFSPVKNVLCGDFDANGYLYTAGRRSGIIVFRPDRSRRDDGYYATDSVTNVRVFNNYLYAATRKGIWRHSLADTSLVGAPELVLDMTQGVFANLVITALSFSSDGSKLYFATDTRSPMFVADAAILPITSDKVEPLYTDILPVNCKNFSFGDYLYGILGNEVFKIDVGKAGAPYYH